MYTLKQNSDLLNVIKFQWYRASANINGWYSLSVAPHCFLLIVFPFQPRILPSAIPRSFTYNLKIALIWNTTTTTTTTHSHATFIHLERNMLFMVRNTTDINTRAVTHLNAYKLYAIHLFEAKLHIRIFFMYGLIFLLDGDNHQK